MKRFFTLLTFFLLLLIWGMAGWALSLKEYEAPEIMIFLGRFHPLILHLPIGFMTLAFLLDVGQILPESLRERIPSPTGLYGLTLLTATGAVVHGILLYASDGFLGSELARRHLIGGCLFLSIVALIFLLKLRLAHHSKVRLSGIPLAMLSMLVMTISSHDGASLTHGENYLSRYAPAFLKPLLSPRNKSSISENQGYKKTVDSTPSAEASLLEENVYAVAIQPIFDRTCVECHKESKKKGKLRMDTYEELMKGGAGGEVVVPGSLEDSYMIELMHLPEDDEEHMPPEGKKQLTAAEEAILEWWIIAGAPAVGSLSSHNPPAEIIKAVEGLARIEE